MLRTAIAYTYSNYLNAAVSAGTDGWSQLFLYMPRSLVEDTKELL